MARVPFSGLLLCMLFAGLSAQAPPPAPQPTPAQVLRGAYGPYRANNDLLYYHLNVRVDPAAKTIAGDNLIRFRMLADGNRIQIDLNPALAVDKILFEGAPLQFERQYGAVFLDFPSPLRNGHVYAVDFFYSGGPASTGRFGGMTFGADSAGHPWINTACEGIGSSFWWPSKDQWKDEVQNMEISVAIPDDLVDVSNGRLLGKAPLGNGYTRWDWMVDYPINSYDVSLNIGNYQHFSDRLGNLPLDFYALPADLERARTQFAQARTMLEAYQHYFGQYPWEKDGYKLIEAPYSGMEHQSAVTYGNHFTNGYLGHDWTGVGISPRFDFIIIHESAHEWFGNSITAADSADEWIHEAWATYLESLYVEYRWGKADGLKYLDGYQSHVRNRQPILGVRGIDAEPPQDMYFKGALMINTLRSVINNDSRWFSLLHNFYQHFKYQTILTEDVVNYWNQATGMNLTPIFDQYLRHTALPVLQLRFDGAAGTVAYRWQADEAGFAMPIRVGDPAHWSLITPVTTAWKTLKTTLAPDQFQVPTDLYFIKVDRNPAQTSAN
ncbi:MAG TPA: M1 family metallopeptidase [Terriglobales bacterium]|nr:M1 family metallopeptidase [Terriglobales bacterium]